MKKASVAIISFLLLVLLLLTTNPNDVSAFVLVIPFVTLLVLIFVTLTSVLQRRGWRPRRVYRGAFIGASIPVVLLVLQSIGQLTVRDILTIGAIFAVLYFYLSHLSFSK